MNSLKMDEICLVFGLVGTLWETQFKMNMKIKFFLGFVVQLMIHVIQHGGICIDVGGVGKMHAGLKNLAIGHCAIVVIVQ